MKAYTYENILLKCMAGLRSWRHDVPKGYLVVASRAQSGGWLRRLNPPPLAKSSWENDKISDSFDLFVSQWSEKLLDLADLWS